jgi:hypothetical protein
LFNKIALDYEIYLKNSRLNQNASWPRKFLILISFPDSIRSDVKIQALKSSRLALVTYNPWSFNQLLKSKYPKLFEKELV